MENASLVLSLPPLRFRPSTSSNILRLQRCIHSIAVSASRRLDERVFSDMSLSGSPSFPILLPLACLGPDGIGH